MNGSSGSSSFMMRGGEIPYHYVGKTNVSPEDLEEFLEKNKALIKDDIDNIRAKAAEKQGNGKIAVTMLKEEKGVTRIVKGVRGAIRHQIMRILNEKGINYCSPTKKETFQSSKELVLLENEHLMGACGKKPCPIRQLFGILGEESQMRVWSNVLVQTDKSLEKVTPQKKVSFVHVSTENRHAARRDNKTLQNFSEQYFSGEFQFYVEFTKDFPEWLLGLLVQGILGITHIGRGRNSGYGRVELKEITYEKVSRKRMLGEETNGRITIIEEEQTENLNEQLQVVLTAWKNYK